VGCGDFVGAKKEGALFFLDKLNQPFFEVLIKSFVAAKAKRNSKFGPNNEMRAFRIDLLAKSDMSFE